MNYDLGDKNGKNEIDKIKAKIINQNNHKYFNSKNEIINANRKFRLKKPKLNNYIIENVNKNITREKDLNNEKYLKNDNHNYKDKYNDNDSENKYNNNYKAINLNKKYTLLDLIKAPKGACFPLEWSCSISPAQECRKSDHR